MASADRTVVFVHGLWLHADSWTPWVERFGAAGYSPTAPGWPGTGASVQETRRNAEAVAGYGIGDVVDHYARIIKALGVKPIVIGTPSAVSSPSFSLRRLSPPQWSRSTLHR